MTLTTLLIHAGIGQWHRYMFFKGAKLTGTVLSVSDEEARRFIDHCWLAKLQELMPGLTLTVGAAEPDDWVTRNIKKKHQKAYRGQLPEQQARLVE